MRFMFPPRPLLCFIPAWLAISCLSLFAQPPQQATEWLTTPDRSSLLAKEPKKVDFEATSTQISGPSITVDEKEPLQTIDGFGFALTGGSAQLLMHMSPAKRHAILEELFGKTGNDIGVSYLRLTIGSSDMNERVFTYDDMPTGETDPKLKHFALGPDLAHVVPVMQEILKINPAIKLLATPWSAPSWMKTNNDPKGGSLKPEYYEAYARYLSLYVKAMKKHGITIDAITPQNEPLNPKNTPSMVMTAEEEDGFLKTALGPVFHQKHIQTKIILYDHNCDRPDYPLTILADSEAAKYTEGSGFHLYAGTIDAMTKVHDAHPEKNLYFTEQMVIDRPGKGQDLRISEPESRIVIGALSNWSRNVLLWNLAADANFGPHTNNGGCPICEGAITIDGDTVTRNLAFYTIAQISKFVPPGSVHIATTETGDVPAHVAFRTSNDNLVLLVANTTDREEDFQISSRGKIAGTSLPPGAVATYVW
jgi:glucosylceramidase